MPQLGEKVVIVADRFEQQLPIGDYGYIIAYDRNADNAFDFVVRIPNAGRNFFVPATDVESEAFLIQQEAERVEREALIDYALATHNESLFRKLVSGVAVEEEAEEVTVDPQSPEDFIKQVNLRAWI